MADPQRLLSGIADGDDLERELLASIKKADPPSGAQAEGWARLSAQIAAVTLVGTAHTSAAAAGGASALGQGASAANALSGGASLGAAAAPTAFKLFSGKIALALAVSGVAIGASAVWVHFSSSHARHNAAPQAAPAASTPPTAQLAAALPAEPDPALQLAPSADDSRPSQSASADQNRKDLLSAESALLTAARAQLRNGNAAAAQQTLNKLRSQFPKGVLRQEREVLTIEVLSARGNQAAARKRARAFIAAYPESPHSAQLSRFADAP